MIKIVQIITRLELGGSTETVLLLCKRLNPDKFKVHLIYGRSLENEFDPSGISSYHVRALKRNISLISDWKAFAEIYRLIGKIGPDIVQTNTSKAGIIGRWAAWLYRRNHPLNKLRIIHMPHGHIFYGYGFGRARMALFKFIERITARVTDNFIAITEGEKRESLAEGIGKPGQWTVIHSDVDCRVGRVKPKNEQRTALSIPADSLVIGTVARLEQVKGVDFSSRPPR